jgi:hypothetical protein
MVRVNVSKYWKVFEEELGIAELLQGSRGYGGGRVKRNY